MKLRIFWFFLIIEAFVFALFVPPFQKPDEETHFYRAMALSNGELSCVTSPAGVRYFPLQKAVFTFPKIMQTENIVMRPDTKFPVGLLKGRYAYRNDPMVSDFSQFCGLPVLAYIPFAVVARAVSPFNNLLITFYAMRVSCVAMLILLVAAGFRLIPKRYRTLYLFIAANPMFIHQATAVSYDALINIVVLFAFAVWLRCMEEIRVSWKMAAMLLVATLTAIAVKPGYYLLAGILVPVIAKFHIPKRSVPLWITGIVAGIGIALTIPALRAVFVLNFVTNLSPQVYIVFHDPWYFMTVIARTVIESRGQLTLGLFGLFGWLDYQLPISMMLLYAFIGGVVSYAYVRRAERPMRTWVIVLLGFIVAGTVMLIFYLFYRNATPSAYYQVEGIQGRYFLPLLPFAALCMLESIVRMKVQRILPVLFTAIGVVCVGVTVFIIYSRYYDLSRSFKNPDELVQEIAQKTVNPDTLTPVDITDSRSFVYDVSAGYKIGGVQMIVANELDVRVPYKISLKDGMCVSTLTQGYLNELRNYKLAHLKGPHDIVTTHYFPITRIPGSQVCLTLEPFAAAPNPVYMRLLGENGKPTVRFLYIAK